jgi:hypothetical protein
MLLTWDSTVSIVNRLQAEQFGVVIPAGGGGGQETFSQNFQTGTGAHPSSSSVGATYSFTRGKVAGVWSWPLAYI